MGATLDKRVRVGSRTVDRAVASITVGDRHRKDLGDLDPLVASIKEHGLLQPIVVTPGGLCWSLARDGSLRSRR
jgi:hypothetical protein